jgi:hypothetical protein
VGPRADRRTLARRRWLEPHRALAPPLLGDWRSIIIVIFSGFENFVSRIDAGDQDRPDWMARVDFGGLKQKLMTSIVDIPAIQVLKAFMNIEHYDSSRSGWLVGIHVLFLPSLLAVVLADRLSPIQHASVRHVAIAGGYSPREYRHKAEISRSAAGVTSRQKVGPITPVRPGDTVIIGERWF